MQHLCFLLPKGLGEKLKEVCRNCSRYALIAYRKSDQNVTSCDESLSMWTLMNFEHKKCINKLESLWCCKRSDYNVPQKTALSFLCNTLAFALFIKCKWHKKVPKTQKTTLAYLLNFTLAPPPPPISFPSLFYTVTTPRGLLISWPYIVFLQDNTY